MSVHSKLNQTKSQLKQSDLHELLFYDPLTGVFTWSKNRRGVITNKSLGTDNGFGYLRITVLGKSYYAHRLAWLYVYGEFPKNQIDHINGNKNDNRIENLRDVSNFDNAQNKINATSKSKSQLLGVSWHKKANKWQAHICLYKIRKYLGLFETKELASQAYLKEREKFNYEFSL
jgi:hypothetical protein